MRRPNQGIKKQVWRRDNYTCLICKGNKKLTVDHLKQFKDGGENTLENLRTLCNDCHIKKDRFKLYIYNFDLDMYEVKVFKTYAVT